MNEIELKLTIDEVNVILEALGNRPFQQVYQIIHKINDQANHQLGGGNPAQQNGQQHSEGEA